MKHIENLQAEILAATKKNVTFTKVAENTFECESETPATVAFFAWKSNFKVKRNKNTVTVTI